MTDVSGNFTTTVERMLLEAVDIWSRCVGEYSIKTCAFATQIDMLNLTCPKEHSWNVVFVNALRHSIYYVYIEEFLKYFPSQNMFVLRTEDLQGPGFRRWMSKLFTFLGVPFKSYGFLSNIVQRKNKNEEIVNELPSNLRNILQSFIDVYTKNLYRILDYDKRFLWNDLIN